MDYVRTAKNNKSVTFSCVSNCFISEVGREEGSKL